MPEPDEETDRPVRVPTMEAEEHWSKPAAMGVVMVEMGHTVINLEQRLETTQELYKERMEEIGREIQELLRLAKVNQPKPPPDSLGWEKVRLLLVGMVNAGLVKFEEDASTLSAANEAIEVLAIRGRQAAFVIDEVPAVSKDDVDVRELCAEIGAIQKRLERAQDATAHVCAAFVKLDGQLGKGIRADERRTVKVYLQVLMDALDTRPREGRIEPEEAF